MNTIERIWRNEHLSVEGYNKRMQFFNLVNEILHDHMPDDIHSLQLHGSFLHMMCHEGSDIDMKVKLNQGSGARLRERLTESFHEMRNILKLYGIETTFMHVSDLYLITGSSQDNEVDFDISLTQRFDDQKTALMSIICARPMLRNYLFLVKRLCKRFITAFKMKSWAWVQVGIYALMVKFDFPYFDPYHPRSSFAKDVKAWFNQSCPVCLEEMLDSFFQFLSDFDLEAQTPIVIVDWTKRRSMNKKKHKKGFNVFEPVGRHRPISPKSWSNPKKFEKIASEFNSAQRKWLELKSA